MTFIYGEIARIIIIITVDDKFDTVRISQSVGVPSKSKKNVLYL